MTKLDTDIKNYINRKKTEKVQVPKWKINFKQGLDEPEIIFSTKNNFRFQYKFHSVLDVCDSGLFFKTKDGNTSSIGFMVNVFVDLLNGGEKEFILTPDMHGLSYAKDGQKKNTCCLIQIFDRSNERCLYAQQIKGIARSK